MKTRRTLSLATLLVAALVSETARSQTIVSDNYTTSNTNSGFALGEGVNSAVNPPTSTRITGSAAANLRYYQTATGKPATVYDINSNRLRVTENSGIGRFTISANGTSPFDFGPALGAQYASATNKATYDVAISMRNNATNTSRFSFAIATVEGDTSVWDFGIQLYHGTTGDNFYTVQKRIDSNSSGIGADMNVVLTNTAAGTWVGGSQGTINFLIRVTDAGAESGANYNSRIQVSTNAGAAWVYDTTTDSALTNGFRFDSTSRIIVFDQAANTSGNVFYDNFSIIASNIPAPPAAIVWTGNGTNDNWSEGNNWGGTPAANSTPLVFNGVVRQTNVNDVTALVIPSITFNNGGFSLSGNSVSNSLAITNLAGVNVLGLELGWDTTSLKTWSIASGSELVLNNINTIEVNGDHNVYGGGTIRLKNAMSIGQIGLVANPPINVHEGRIVIDGGSITTRGGYRIGSQATGSGAQTVISNGGSLTITATSGNLRVGDSANPQGARLDLDSGLVSLTGSAVFAVGYATGATGTVNQTGGLITVPIVSFSESGAGSGIYTNKNGALSTGQIRKNNANGSGAIYFDNAVLNTAAGAVEATFFTGLNTAQIGAGGLTLDVTTPVTIGQALSGPGALVKSNFGTATLTGTNTYSGNTAVLDGKLVLPTVQTNAAAIQVADGKEFGVLVRNPGTTLTAASLAFLGGSFATLSFDLSTFSTPTAPLMRVSSVSFNSPISVNVVNGNQLGVGQIKLVDYDGTIGGIGFSGAFTTDPILPPGVFGYLSNNVATTSIDLVITGVPGLRWTGAANNDWDFSTVNWFDKQNSVAATYADLQPLEFLDGGINKTINVNITATSPSIVVSNTTPYVWNNGTINTDLLKKSGAGTLTRATTNADTIGTIELNAGSLITSIPLDINYTTVLVDNTPATGSFVKANTNTMTMASANSTYDGGFVVQQGTLFLNTTTALGTTNGGTTIAAGATLDLNNIIFPHEAVTVAGSGVGGVGAIIDSTTGGGVAHNLTDVTMTGDTTFGAPTGGRWDIRVRSSSGAGPGLKGGGFNLTKVGSGFVSIACQRNLGAATPYWQMNLGDILISEGTLAFAESLSLGNPAKALTVNSNATLQFFDMGFTNPIVRNITMTDARLNLDGDTTDTNVFNGGINLTGANTVHANQSISFFNGAFTGGGALNMFATSPGRVILNGANTFAGDTTVTNGTLGGVGSLTGNLVMLGGTNAPGMGVGTFTVNGAATLGGTTLMELNRNLSPNSDRLVVGGALNFGGILQVVLGAGAPAPQAGNVYQLFNKAGSGSFSLIALPNLSSGLTWDTSNLAVNGSISVTDPNAKPAITNVAVVGANFIFSGTGGTAGNPYIIYSTTNLNVPLASWTPVTTNTFGVGGTFNVTNAFSPAVPASFYRLFAP